ncbi:Transmembrane emp24 domain-containing protein [Vigna angularis]|uniref:Transmembrane emp24 domain-containing protein n=1 Tax=Phaseolus angularis TaxID=3914 RepID=A0A8T0K1X0_PHAAN|nr:Transmembrane emp24 domain-containing protein [Vigna angularis]
MLPKPMAASSLSHPQTCHASHPRNPNPTTNQNRHRTPSRSATGSDLDAILLRHRSRSCSATGRDLDAISQHHRTQSGHDLVPPPDAIWLRHGRDLSPPPNAIWLRHGRDLSPRRTGAASLLSSPPPKLDKETVEGDEALEMKLVGKEADGHLCDIVLAIFYFTEIGQCHFVMSRDSLGGHLLHVFLDSTAASLLKPFFPEIIFPRASNSCSIELTVRFDIEIVVRFAIKIPKYSVRSLKAFVDEGFDREKNQNQIASASTNGLQHLTPLFEEIVKLERALFNIQCEQHWLEAHPERQAIEYSSQLGAPDKVLFYLCLAINSTSTSSFFVPNIFLLLFTEPFNFSIDSRLKLKILSRKGESTSKHMTASNGIFLTWQNIILKLFTTIHMDKAALLESVIDHVKDLKRKAMDVSRAFTVPTEIDEVSIDSEQK